MTPPNTDELLTCEDVEEDDWLETRDKVPVNLCLAHVEESQHHGVPGSCSQPIAVEGETAVSPS